MTRTARAALLVGWVGVIALLGWYVQANLTISGGHVRVSRR